MTARDDEVAAVLRNTISRVESGWLRGQRSDGDRVCLLGGADATPASPAVRREAMRRVARRVGGSVSVHNDLAHDAQEALEPVWAELAAIEGRSTPLVLPSSGQSTAWRASEREEVAVR